MTKKIHLESCCGTFKSILEMKEDDELEVIYYEGNQKKIKFLHCLKDEEAQQ